MMSVTRLTDATISCIVAPARSTCCEPAPTLPTESSIRPLICRLRCAAPATHFARHHREALALLARPSRFHCRVQRQDVGLERNTVDHRHDLGNLARAGRIACIVVTTSDTAEPPRRPRPTRWPPADWPARVVRVLLYGRGQLLHRSRRLFQRGRLLLGAAGQVRIARRDLARTDVDLVHAATHRRHRARQAFLHALDRGEQRADLIGAAHLDAAGEIAAGDLVEMAAGLVHGRSTVRLMKTQQPSARITAIASSAMVTMRAVCDRLRARASASVCASTKAR